MSCCRPASSSDVPPSASLSRGSVTRVRPSSQGPLGRLVPSPSGTHCASPVGTYVPPRVEEEGHTGDPRTTTTTLTSLPPCGPCRGLGGETGGTGPLVSNLVRLRPHVPTPFTPVVHPFP